MMEGLAFDRCKEIFVPVACGYGDESFDFNCEIGMILFVMIQF